MKNIKFILTTLLLLGILVSCTTNKIVSTPDCINSIKDDILKTKVQTPRANISKYTYKGKEVFVVAAQNFPDGEDIVMDLNCNQICALGGIDGQPSAGCTDFSNEAVFIELVWTDPR